MRIPFGGTSVYIIIGVRKSASLPRRGPRHSYLAHTVNYRANNWGFRKFGVEHIFGTSVIGSLKIGILNGYLVVPEQPIDQTKHKHATFNLGSLDFTEPNYGQTCQLILELAGGELAEGVVDVWAEPYHAHTVAMRAGRCRTLLGTDVDDETQAAILERLGLAAKLDGGRITCTIPSW